MYSSEKIIKKFLTKVEISYAEEVLHCRISPETGDKYITVNHVYKYVVYSDKAACEKACKSRAKAIKKMIAKKEGVGYTEGALMAKVKECLAARRQAEASVKRAMKEEDKILREAGKERASQLFETLRTGENIGRFSASYADKNGIECHEYNDFTGYSRSCGFIMKRRSFCMSVKKGWHVETIGGLITFIRGEVRRGGMACDWIEQGRSIADLKTVSGYLVRGEHIEAKSLAEAKRISAQHRSAYCARLLSQRKKKAERIEAYKNGELRVTFDDSLAAGNCRPGTAEFKRKYEEAIGREADSISVDDLRKYAEKFGVSKYAERVIKYVLGQ